MRGTHLSDSPSLAAKQVILHEFLHYAKIDNYSTALHAAAQVNGLVGFDNVYNCAYAVYPAKEIVELHHPLAVRACADAEF